MTSPEIRDPEIPGIDAIVPFAVPLTARFRGVSERHGLLLHGAQGWGEWSPFDEYDDTVAAVWFAAALDAARTPAPLPLRGEIPVNVTVPRSPSAVRGPSVRRLVRKRRRGAGASSAPQSHWSVARRRSATC